MGALFIIVVIVIGAVVLRLAYDLLVVFWEAFRDARKAKKE